MKTQTALLKKSVLLSVLALGLGLNIGCSKSAGSGSTESVDEVQPRFEKPEEDPIQIKSLNVGDSTSEVIKLGAPAADEYSVGPRSMELSINCESDLNRAVEIEGYGIRLLNGSSILVARNEHIQPSMSDVNEKNYAQITCADSSQNSGASQEKVNIPAGTPVYDLDSQKEEVKPIKLALGDDGKHLQEAQIICTQKSTREAISPVNAIVVAKGSKLIVKAGNPEGKKEDRVSGAAVIRCN